jgi:hypothetical protein
MSLHHKAGSQLLYVFQVSIDSALAKRFPTIEQWCFICRLQQKRWWDVKSKVRKSTPHARPQPVSFASYRFARVEVPDYMYLISSCRQSVSGFCLALGSMSRVGSVISAYLRRSHDHHQSRNIPALSSYRVPRALAARA